MRQLGLKAYISACLTKIRPWLTIFSAASFFFLINSSTNLTAVTPYLSAKFHFDAAAIGFLFACYYYSNFLFVFFAGIILDRLSTKKTLIASYIIINFSILIFAFTKSLALMALARLVSGIVGSFSMLYCFQIIKRYFPPQKTSLITGVVITYATLGTLFSQTPLLLAIERFGWRTGLLLNFWLGIAFCFFAIVFAQDFSPNIRSQASSANNHTTIWQSIKKTTANFQNFLIGFYTSLLNLPILFLSASWGILYLQQAKNFTKIDGSYIISAYTLGFIIGSSLVGWLSDKLHARKLPLITGNFFMIIVLLAITYITTSSLFIFIMLFFAFGLASSAQVVSYPLIAGNNSPRLVSTATGFVATLTALSGAYMPFLGWVIDRLAVNQQAYNFYPVMLILIAILIISMLLALFIKESKKEVS